MGRRSVAVRAKQIEQGTTAREEQVLRMRFGVGVDLDAPLPQVVEPGELGDRLRSIERRLFDALRERARASGGKARNC